MSGVPKVANIAGAESKVYVKLSFTDDIVEINGEGWCLLLTCKDRVILLTFFVLSVKRLLVK